MCTPHGRHGSNERTAPHDVHALEVLRAVLLEDRRVLHGVLVRAGGAVDVARVGVPRGRRVGLVVGDLALADDHVVREHAARGLVEADADRLFGDLEVRPALRPPRPDLDQRLLEAVQPDQRRVGLVVGARAVALDRVGLLGHVPLELHLGHAGGLRQHHLHAVAGRLEVADVDQPGLRRHPLAGERAAAGVTGDVGVVALRRTCAATRPSCTCRPSRASAAWAASPCSTDGACRPGCRAGPG